jgi:hypothetical protein
MSRHQMGLRRVNRDTYRVDDILSSLLFGEGKVGAEGEFGGKVYWFGCQDAEGRVRCRGRGWLGLRQRWLSCDGGYSLVKSSIDMPLVRFIVALFDFMLWTGALQMNQSALEHNKRILAATLVANLSLLMPGLEVCFSSLGSRLL